MPQQQRVTIEQIVEAYRSTGSVWKSAKLLGICGQSVHERLKAIDYPMQRRWWNVAEDEELAHLSNSHTISQIAAALGRPYYAIAIRMSRMGLAKRYGNRMKRNIPRGIGLDKISVHRITKELSAYQGSLRSFSKMKGIQIESLVHAIQKYEIDFWKEYSKSHTDIEEAICPYCESSFHPMSKRQKFCTRKCSADAKSDEGYFGGRRRETIGLAEGICQLCLQQKDKGLSSHHMLGKENDPENMALIALCAGCHQIIGQLAGRKFIDSPEGWENLIQIVMARRMAEKSKEFVGVYSCVEFEYLKKQDIEEECQA